MPSIFEYDLDTTGRAENNLVTGEIHNLIDSQNIRAIAPVAGAFFVDTVKIFSQNAEKFLVANKDYVVVQLYESLSLKYGRSIAGVILVTDTSLTGEVTLSYQCLGGYFNRTETDLVNHINNNTSNRLDATQWVGSQMPPTFMPSSEVHDLGDEITFEYINYAIEKLRNAINGGDMSSVAYIEQYIENFRSSVMNFISEYIDDNLKGEIQDQLAFFSKETINLGNVVNYSKATEDNGRKYAAKSYKFTQNSDNRYITTAALMGFKEVLYNAFISSNITGIDKYKGVVAVPTINTLTIMTNGARYVFDSLQNVQLNRVPYDLSVYPDPTDGEAKWVVYKLSNSESNKDGVFLAFNIRTSEMYTGLLTDTGRSVTNINWIKQITQVDKDKYIGQVVDHINDNSNPHKTNKFHVKLGNVENLSTVTREDVLCRKPIRKYVTHDALILFWKLFLNGIKTLDDEPDPNDEMDVAERFRLIFAPCGPCGTDGARPAPAEPIKAPGIEPRGKLLAVWCVKYDKYGRYTDGFGSTYEELVESNSVDCRYKGNDGAKERGEFLSSYCEGTTKYARYADGKGSFYVGILEENSPECGAASTSAFTLVEVQDDVGTVYGYGFSPDKAPPDPDADVLLQTDEGENICYIFSEPKASTVGALSATVEITDTFGNVVGYAIVAD